MARAGRAHARALRRGPAAVRPRGPRPALRDAADLARRLGDPRRASRPRATTCSAAARTTASLARLGLAWRAWRWRAPPAGSIRAMARDRSPRGSRARAAPASTTRSASCPAEKRRAIYALYSFCRVVDDCVDEPDGEGEAGLAPLAGGGRGAATPGSPRPSSAASWRRRSRAVPDPARAASRTSWRAAAWTSRAARYADLRRPARLLRARGLRGGPGLHRDLRVHAARARASYAVELGVALQLTNILRDVAADAARGPALPPAGRPRALRGRRGARSSRGRRPGGARRAACALLLGFQAERAREHYARARPLLPAEDRRAMLPAEIMGAVYRALLEELARRGFPLAGPRRAAVAPAQGLDRAARRSPRVPAAREGGRGRGRLRRPGGRHRPAGAPPRGARCSSGAACWAAARPRIATPSRGEDVDNGTHLMIGAYRDDARPAAPRGGRGPAARAGRPAHRLRATTGAGRRSTARALPAPLHLLAGLAGPARCRWRARLEALRLGLAVALRPRAARAHAGRVLRAARARGRGARRLLWDPLATADPQRDAGARRRRPLLQRASARRSCARSARVAPRVPARAATARLHERLAAYFEARGGAACAGARWPRRSSSRAAAPRGVRYVQRRGDQGRHRAGAPAPSAARVDADAVVAAVPWRALPGAAARGRCARRPPFAELPRGWAARPSSPSSCGSTAWSWTARWSGLRDCEVEWVFDKGRLYGRAGAPQHLAFIVSAAVPQPRRGPTPSWWRRAEAALRRYFPAMADARGHALARPARAGGDVRLRRPRRRRCGPGPHARAAASSWPATGRDTGLPATIEGAVRSGLRGGGGRSSRCERRD